MRAVALRVCLKSGKIDYREFRLLGSCLLTIANKHRASKERMPGQLGDDSDWQLVFQISSDKSVLDKQVATSSIGHHALS